MTKEEVASSKDANKTIAKRSKKGKASQQKKRHQKEDSRAHNRRN